MPRRKKTELPRPELNITAMMDLVLNLITFFVLIANFASASLPPIAAPTPDHSLAGQPLAPNQVIVNILANPGDDSRAMALQLGVDQLPLDNHDLLIQLLQKEVGISKDVEITIRADKNLRYDQVQPVMDAIAAAGVLTVHLTAMTAD